MNGFFILLKIDPNYKLVKAHERTLSKPKTDRLNLMQACHANLEPIQLLYIDETDKIRKKIDGSLNKPVIDVTGHDAKLAARAIRILREACIPGNFSMDFITAPNNWANQVRWFSPDRTLPVYRNNPCPWLARGQVMIMSDGNITNCCIDGLAKGGSVD